MAVNMRLVAALSWAAVGQALSYPAYLEIDIINPQPGAVYQHPNDPFPITFAVQNNQLAEGFGYSFAWNLRSNVTKPPLFGVNGASIGTSPAISFEVPRTHIWQSECDISAQYAFDGPIAYYLDWQLTFYQNCTQPSAANSTVDQDPSGKNASGTIPFFTSPDAVLTPDVTVGGTSGRCATLVEVIAVTGNITQPEYASGESLGSTDLLYCPELGQIGNDTTHADPCAVTYSGPATEDVQTDLFSSMTISGASVAPTASPTAQTTSPTTGSSAQSRATTSSSSASPTSSAAQTAASTHGAAAVLRAPLQNSGLAAMVLGGLALLA